MNQLNAIDEKILKFKSIQRNQNGLYKMDEKMNESKSKPNFNLLRKNI